MPLIPESSLGETPNSLIIFCKSNCISINLTAHIITINKKGNAKAFMKSLLSDLFILN